MSTYTTPLRIRVTISEPRHPTRDEEKNITLHYPKPQLIASRPAAILLPDIGK